MSAEDRKRDKIYHALYDLMRFDDVTPKDIVLELPQAWKEVCQHRMEAGLEDIK